MSCASIGIELFCSGFESSQLIKREKTNVTIINNKKFKID
jgi:hypothetical protein